MCFLKSCAAAIWGRRKSAPKKKWKKEMKRKQTNGRKERKQTKKKGPKNKQTKLGKTIVIEYE